MIIFDKYNYKYSDIESSLISKSPNFYEDFEYNFQLVYYIPYNLKENYSDFYNYFVDFRSYYDSFTNQDKMPSIKFVFEDGFEIEPIYCYISHAESNDSKNFNSKQEFYNGIIAVEPFTN